ncbi:hypothetical protein C1H46_028921 [Malus baccata]|uniref:HMG box domain-containing protein n=1 Tax=Malus baccata TaxID=106549 RepID=A0A540LGN8_MALBA|nr:hypothetical protein C1H46_028921 [Malus baccata]
MVLKVQQSEGTRRSTRLSSVNMEGKRIVSVKKSKTKQKKKSAKVDSKIPKKPPTAFFYFLQTVSHQSRELLPVASQEFLVSTSKFATTAAPDRAFSLHDKGSMNYPE